MRAPCMLQPYGMSDQLLSGAHRAALALAEARKLEADAEGYQHWLSVAERLKPDAGRAACEPAAEERAETDFRI